LGSAGAMTGLAGATSFATAGAAGTAVGAAGGAKAGAVAGAGGVPGCVGALGVVCEYAIEADETNVSANEISGL
jgi:hypothetical protein